MYELRIGEHYKETNPFREIIDCGVVICGSSESDVTPMGPMLGIYSAVNHPVENHRVGAHGGDQDVYHQRRFCGF